MKSDGFMGIPKAKHSCGLFSAQPVDFLETIYRYTYENIVDDKSELRYSKLSVC